MVFACVQHQMVIQYFNRNCHHNYKTHWSITKSNMMICNWRNLFKFGLTQYLHVHQLIFKWSFHNIFCLQFNFQLKLKYFAQQNDCHLVHCSNSKLIKWLQFQTAIDFHTLTSIHVQHKEQAANCFYSMYWPIRQNDCHFL